MKASILTSHIRLLSMLGWLSSVLFMQLSCPAFAQTHASADLSECAALSDPTAYETKKISDGYFYIVPGADGWLFRTKQDLVSDFSIHPAIKDKFRAVQEAFARKGTDIIFVFLPTRGIVAADKIPTGNPLTEGYDPAKAQASYTAALADARESGLNFVGLPSFEGDEKFYFKTDHHWNANGARQMAAQVAAFAKTLPSYQKLHKESFVTTEKGTEHFETTFQDPIQDLCGIKLPDAVNTLYETVPASSGTEADLFGDAHSPEVVLVGTSNSNPDRFHPNFEGSLKEFLETDILNAAITGGGFDDSILSYLASNDFQKSPPKLVIWEIPGYYGFREKESQKPVFDQLMPSITGNCASSALVSTDPIPLNANKIPLFTKLGKVDLKGKDAYFDLEFSNPVKKAKFTLYFQSPANKQIHKIKFKRSDRFIPDGSFFYTFQASKIDITDSVILDIPNEMKSGTVQARICSGK